MKASLKWLKEFVDFSLSARELSHALTMAGLEVEGMEDFEDDVILDINITPNRPDCLGIKGIAREVAAILGLPFKDTPVVVSEERGDGPAIEIADPQLCSRYASRIIYGVKPGPSPEWISKRLEAHGFRSTCNIVDITNYVLLETGHPLHAFDLDKLTENKIIVRPVESEMSFQTLDGEDRTMTQRMLLIWDPQKPIAIAGVMGGANSEVTLSTVNVLLESAYFDPISIRRTSKALNLTTEASYRFERGADINGIVSALDRATQMIVEIAGGQATRLSDSYPKPFVPRQIVVRFEKIKSLLGIEIDESEIKRLLNNLGLYIERVGEGIVVTPPSFRQDLQRDIDIIEEIARLYGYDKIPSTLPKVKMQYNPDNTSHKLIKTIKDSMVKSGFTEVINYSFFNPAVLDRLNISSDDQRRNLVFVKNPLRREEAALRTTLIPSLLHNLILNLNRGEKAMSFFEISRVFFSSGEKLPKEIVQMAAVYLKDISTSVWQDSHDGFFDLKGMVENLLRGLNIKNYSFEQELSFCEPYLHPGKSCSIKIDNQRVGSLGALHPGVATVLELKGDINLMEIYDIEKVSKSIPSQITYTPLPKYPYVERDIAIVVSKDIPVARVRDAILSVNSDLIESVKLFDIYTGQQIPPDKKSLAFSIRYRSKDRTLKDEEVNALHLKIIKELEASINAKLRS
jgi:phenylalanyl-tRNA synthetase beta chain